MPYLAANVWLPVAIGVAGAVVAAALLVLLRRSRRHLAGAAARFRHIADEQRRADREARDAREMLRAVTEGITEPVFVKDREGRYVLANTAYAALANRASPAEVIGRTDEELFPPTVAAAVRDADGRILQWGITQTYEETLVVGGMPRNHLTTTGPWVNGDGEIAGLLGIKRDLTSWRSAERVLRQSERRLRSILDGLIAMVGVLAPDGRVVEMNRAALAASGAAGPDHVVGRPIEDTGPWNHSGEERARLRAAVERAASGEPARIDSVITDAAAGGKLATVDFMISPLRDADERVTLLVASAIDITERKQAEELYLKQQAELAHLSRVSVAGQMATGLAHELNQPLGAILNYATACLGAMEREGAAPDGVAARCVREIAQETKRAGEIIKRLRTFLKKQEPRASSVDINDVVRESVRLLAWDLRRTGVEARLTLAAALPLVRADVVQVEQVLVNMIRNAAEATAAAAANGGAPLGQRPLTVWTAPAAGDGPMVRVGVTDRGPGLPPAALARMFDAFFTTKPDGLGIGLTISRSIIEAHTGKLWARPNPDDEGGGLTVEFTLPVSEVAGR